MPPLLPAKRDGGKRVDEEEGEEDVGAGSLYRDDTLDDDAIRMNCFDGIFIDFIERTLLMSDTVGSGVAASTVARSVPASKPLGSSGETSKPFGIFCNKTFRPVIQYLYGKVLVTVTAESLPPETIQTFLISRKANCWATFEALDSSSS